MSAPVDSAQSNHESTYADVVQLMAARWRLPAHVAAAALRDMSEDVGVDLDDLVTVILDSHRR